MAEGLEVVLKRRIDWSPRASDFELKPFDCGAPAPGEIGGIIIFTDIVLHGLADIDNES